MTIDANTLPLVAGDDPAALAAASPDWLATLRRAALARYGQVGLPGPRTEAWKFTGLNALKALQPVPAAGAVDLGLPEALKALECVSIRVVNGRAEALPSDLPAGVEVVSLGDPAAVPDWVRVTLGGVVSIEASPFAALNTAQFTGGVAIRVARGAMPEAPILLSLLQAGGDGTATIAHPRVLVVVEEGASADLVTVHQGGGGYLANPVTEITVAEGARLGHAMLQAEGPEAFHVATTALRLAGRATYDGFVLATGGRLARHEVRAELDGEHIEYSINGVYLGAGEQHHDITTFIDHARPHGTSHEMVKGVLTGRSRGVFQGKILVRPDAQKTDGFQMNRALLLSRDAEVDSKPELEIYADDVKCSHGATVGELEDEQLFYLMARGIPRARARAMLVEAYVQEAIALIGRAPVRDAFAAVATAWLDRHVAGTGE
ncbi:MAG: Fe-S cluster assembly protein SufD [Thalassobaculum sp.]|uniref:Fe-S cluster assembly protein SufD n=1 Tax=Thalassobaculum sp. TaxID=2022740 RepID=UPI0032EB4875